MADSTELARLKAAVEAAESETASVRAKLHSAIRKGRAIESEKNAKNAQLEALQQQIKAPKAPQEQQIPQTEDPAAQIAALKAQLQQAQEQAEQQLREAQGSADGRAAELQSRAEYIKKLEDMLKARQRALAEKQGECVMAQAAAEGFRQSAEAAEARLKQQDGQLPDLKTAPPSEAAADHRQALLGKLEEPWSPRVRQRPQAQGLSM